MAKISKIRSNVGSTAVPRTPPRMPHPSTRQGRASSGGTPACTHEPRFRRPQSERKRSRTPSTAVGRSRDGDRMRQTSVRINLKQRRTCDDGSRSAVEPGSAAGAAWELLEPFQASAAKKTSDSGVRMLARRYARWGTRRARQSDTWRRQRRRNPGKRLRGRDARLPSVTSRGIPESAAARTITVAQAEGRDDPSRGARATVRTGETRTDSCRTLHRARAASAARRAPPTRSKHSGCGKAWQLARLKRLAMDNVGGSTTLREATKLSLLLSRFVVQAARLTNPGSHPARGEQGGERRPR